MRIDWIAGLSQRSVTTGSTRMARRAGIAQPSKPERMSTAATQMKVSGSRGTFHKLGAHAETEHWALSPPLRREAKQLVEVVVGCAAGISFGGRLQGEAEVVNLGSHGDV